MLFLTDLGLPEGVAASIISLIAVYSVIFCILKLAIYLIRAIAVYKMANKTEGKLSFLAFIPIVNYYTFGKIAEKYNRKGGKPSSKFGATLLSLNILNTVSGIALSVFSVLSVNQILDNAQKAIDGNYDMTVSMLSSVIPVIIFFVILVMLLIITAVVHYVALWRVLAVFDYKNATVFTVLSVLFSVLEPIFLIIVSKNEPFFKEPVLFEEFQNEQ